MKEFGVCIPIRGNIKGLRVTLGAFELFTAKKDQLSIALVADNDDPELGKYIELCREFDLNITVYPVYRSEHFCRDYYNYGVIKTNGENVLVFNDDCYVQTNEWDNIIRKKINESKHLNGIYLVDIWDSTHNVEGSCFPRFPMISRKAIDVLGYFFHPSVRMWPADKVIWELYSNAGCVIQCHEVKLQHDHIANGDVTKSRLYRIFQEDIASGVFPVKLGTEINKLKGAINEKNGHSETIIERRLEPSGSIEGDTGIESCCQQYH